VNKNSQTHVVWLFLFNPGSCCFSFKKGRFHYFFLVRRCGMRFLYSMKKIIIITTLLLFTACTSLLAQQQEALEKYQANRAKLNLTEEQEKKVKAIDSVYLTSLEGLRKEGGSRISKLRKFKDMTSAKDQQMKVVLDKEQYKIYQAQQKEMKEMVKNKRRQH
jgi:hypothetical protein